MDRVMIETSLMTGNRRFVRVYTDKDGRRYVRTGKGARVRKYLDQMRAEKAGPFMVYREMEERRGCSLGSYREQMIDAGRGHLLRDAD